MTTKTVPANAEEGMKWLADLSRRDLLVRGASAAGWTAFGLVVATGTVETLNFFFPRVVFRPPSRFKVGPLQEFTAAAGTPDTYGVILVDQRWKSSERFFLVREQSRIHAASARCPHLGCTVNWFEDSRAFKCPCHGSEYHSNGVNFAGPAPRPLDRLRVELNAEGEIVVDTAIVYGPDRYGVDGAFIEV